LRIDGRRIIPAYLFEVKEAGRVEISVDYYKLIATISPEDAANAGSQRVPAGEEVSDGYFHPSLQAKRSNPLIRRCAAWIASSYALAMTTTAS